MRHRVTELNQRALPPPPSPLLVAQVSGREVHRVIKFAPEPLPGMDVRSVLLRTGRLTDEESKKVTLMADLLDKALAMDPAKRITAAAALKHPFLTPSRGQ